MKPTYVSAFSLTSGDRILWRGDILKVLRVEPRPHVPGDLFICVAGGLGFNTVAVGQNDEVLLVRRWARKFQRAARGGASQPSSGAAS